MGLEEGSEKHFLETTRKKQGLFVRFPPMCKCPKLYPSYTTRSRRRCCDIAVYVRVLWAVLSLLVSAACCLAFVEPYWLTNTERRTSFGMYSYCIQDNYLQARIDYHSPEYRQNATHDIPELPAAKVQYVTHYRENCGPYGHYFRLAHLPSNAWQIACVLYGGGCVLQAFGALAAMVTSVMVDWWATRFAGYTGYIQTMGVMTCAGGLLTFPLGLDSNFVRHYCTDARMFYSGGCDVGWAFTLGIMGTALSVFCPFLSQYVTFRIKGENDTNSL